MVSATTHVLLTLALAYGCCMWTTQVSAQGSWWSNMQLQLAIEQHNSTIAELQFLTNQQDTTIKQQNATITDLQALSKQQSSTITDLQRQNNQQDTTIKQQDSSIKNLEAKTQQQDTTIKQLDSSIKNLEAKTQQQDTTIKQQDSSMKQQDISIKDLEAKTKQQDTTIKQQTHTETGTVYCGSWTDGDVSLHTENGHAYTFRTHSVPVTFTHSYPTPPVVSVAVQDGAWDDDSYAWMRLNATDVTRSSFKVRCALYKNSDHHIAFLRVRWTVFPAGI